MAQNAYPSADAIARHAKSCSAKTVVLDHNGTIVSVNKAWRLSAVARGYDAAGHGVGVNYLALCDQTRGPDADYARQAAEAIRCVLAGEGSAVTFEYVCASLDHELWAMFVASPLPPQCQPGAIVAHVDITPVKDVEQAFRQSGSYIQAHGQTLPGLVSYVDAGQRYQFNNEAYEAWFGIPISELRGRPVADIVGETHYQRVRPYIESCLSGQTVEYDIPLILKNERRVQVRCTMVPHRHEDGPVQGMFVSAHDVTKERSLALRAGHLSMHDALTGLPNRSLFQAKLKSVVEASPGSGLERALMIVDLDDFKDVNDTLGHPIGDKLLCAVARRLTDVVSSDDAVARLGGDEFAIIQHDIATDHDAQILAKTIIDRLEAPFCIEEHEIHISASIGITILRDDVEDIYQLVKRADLALYRAKSEGRGRCQIFIDEMWANLMRRGRLLLALRQALDTDQLSVRYQPQIDLKTGAVMSAEALARWRHPKCGDIEPELFIDVAESGGLIGALGLRILRQASEQATAWRRAGHQFRVATNVSPRQIRHPAFVDHIRQIMAVTRVKPDWLEFEITETLLIDTARRDLRVLDEIAEMGIHLAIDDFGSGYSSLAYLKRLPVDKIKIDQCFVRDIGVDAEDEAIIKAIISLSHQLGKRVTAEGVETEVQATFLAENGCDEAQGFYFARPQTSKDMEPWLRRRYVRPIGRPPHVSFA